MLLWGTVWIILRFPDFPRWVVPASVHFHDGLTYLCCREAPLPVPDLDGVDLLREGGVLDLLNAGVQFHWRRLLELD